MSRRETLPPRGERAAARRERAAAVMAALHTAYPDARCALTYESPWQLLVATILSAQCTDERVNMVTPPLFARYPDAPSLAVAPLDEVEELVRSTGFFRSKAKHIVGAAQAVMRDFDGVLPDTVDELVRLPGVARKTANVVVSNCFLDNIDGIAVDTHVQRIARRLGFTRSYETNKIERDLMRLIERDEWPHVTHLLIDHGRAICNARAPLCASCPVAEACPSAQRFS